MNTDPHDRVRCRVAERLTRHVGRTVRVGGEADRLILAVRDEMVYRQGEVAIMELRLLLEECLTELDEFEKVHA